MQKMYTNKFSLWNLQAIIYIQILVQTIEQAKSYFKRKVKYVTEQMEKVQMLGIEKSQVRDGIITDPRFVVIQNYVYPSYFVCN